MKCFICVSVLYQSNSAPSTKKLRKKDAKITLTKDKVCLVRILYTKLLSECRARKSMKLILSKQLKFERMKTANKTLKK